VLGAVAQIGVDDGEQLAGAGDDDELEGLSRFLQRAPQGAQARRSKLLAIGGRIWKRFFSSVLKAHPPDRAPGFTAECHPRS
jgi:hypothetical protein